MFLERTNNTTVSQAVISALNENSIAFNDVVVVNTDSAAYILKAFREVLSVVLPNAVHVTCLAHLMNIVSEAFQKPYELADKFIKCFHQQFYLAGHSLESCECYFIAANAADNLSAADRTELLEMFPDALAAASAKLDK